MPKKKREYMNVWEWLLNMGPWKASLLVNFIAAVILVASMWIMNWLIKR